MNETSDVARATSFHIYVIRTPILTPDFAGAPPFYYCGFIQQSSSRETGKRLAKFQRWIISNEIWANSDTLVRLKIAAA
ncbi:hypothetical protein [Enterobacter sp. C4G1]|uniref:hypothetical protein n=1 Tax=Enterobacter sp. C4G1 TaxID=3458724 RepID=UPI004068F8E9